MKEFRFHLPTFQPMKQSIIISAKEEEMQGDFIKIFSKQYTCTLLPMCITIVLILHVALSITGKS